MVDKRVGTGNYMPCSSSGKTHVCYVCTEIHQSVTSDYFKGVETYDFYFLCTF